MYCLLICGEYDDDIAAVCPVCHKGVDCIYYSDYVKDNIVLWCKNCGEILMCCGQNQEQNSINNYLNQTTNLHPCSCIKEITHQQAIEIESQSEIQRAIELSENWFPDQKNPIRYLLIGVIELTHSISESELGINSSNESDSEYDEDQIPSLSMMKKFTTPIVKLQDSEFDTDHDGVFLFYAGVCSECNRQCRSVIWGD